MGSTGSGSDCGAARRLDQIRGGAPGRPPSVRVLAGFSQNTACRLAALGFAAGVDFDRLLAGTRFRPAVVGPLRPPIEAHYQPLVRRAWDLLWRCRNRELARLEAPSVGRRCDADRQEYTRHVDWLNRNGLRRTRQTPVRRR